MNPPNSYQAPPEIAPLKKSFPVVPVIVGVLLAIVALVALIGFTIFRAVQADSSAATAVSNNFIDAMGRHDYVASHALFTSEVQAKTAVSSLEDIETLVEKRKGAYVSHGTPQWFVQNWNGQTRTTLTYPAQFANGPDTITMTMVQSGKECRVFEAHYEL